MKTTGLAHNKVLQYCIFLNTASRNSFVIHRDTIEWAGGSPRITVNSSSSSKFTATSLSTTSVNTGILEYWNTGILKNNRKLPMQAAPQNLLQSLPHKTTKGRSKLKPFKPIKVQFRRVLQFYIGCWNFELSAKISHLVLPELSFPASPQILLLRLSQPCQN